ncbi:MAG: hypothetical protein Q7S26_01290 [bacterium]|nr:hypothetical protein [bacterium]
MKKALFVCGLLLLPTVVFGAGFSKQSLFLSKSTVVEGDTVLIHAVVSNDTTAKFTGTLVLKDSDSTIGNVPVALAAGEANTFSVSWKPTAGNHIVEADLEDKSGTVVEQESATFTVAEKPPPPPKATDGQVNPNASSTVESSVQIQQTIANMSPAVAQSAQPVFLAIDSARRWAAGVLDRGITYEKGQLAHPDASIGAGKTATQTGAVQGWVNTLWTIIGTIVLYILSVLRWLVGNAGAFYPALALLFFYLLWRLYKKMRRSR